MKWLSGITGLLILATAGSGCTDPEQIPIVYQVQALGSTSVTADIRYLEAGIDTIDEDDVALPWQKYLGVDSGDLVYLRAVSNGPDSVTLSAAIFLEGLVLEFMEETGINVVVAVSDTVP